MITLGVVLYATLWPDPTGSVGAGFFPGADKLIHAIMMGGLLGAIIFDRRRSGKRLTVKFVVYSALCLTLFSAVDEIAQHYMNLGRTWDIMDFGADCGGLIIATLSAPPVVNRIFRNSVKH